MVALQPQVHMLSCCGSTRAALTGGIGEGTVGSGLASLTLGGVCLNARTAMGLRLAGFAARGPHAGLLSICEAIDERLKVDHTSSNCPNVQPRQ